MASDAASTERRRLLAARALKIAGGIVAAFVLVVLLLVAFVSSRYFGAAVEAELAKGLLEGKRRALKFEGPLEFTFWPNLGFRVGRVSLSEPGGAQEFASIAGARAAVAVTPLLSGRIVAGDCAVEGLKLALVRRRDGSLNIADLLPTEPSGRQFPFEIAAIRVDASQLTWTDETAGKTTAVKDVQLTSGRVQGDPAAKSYQAKDVSLAGAVGSTRLRLGVADLAVAAAALSATGLSFGADFASPTGTAIGAALNGRLAADFQQTSVALEEVTGDIAVTHPRLVAKPLKLPLQGALHAARDKAAGELALHVDESKAQFKFDLVRFSPLAIRFDAEIDRLDLDRYLAPPEGGGEPGKGSPLDLSDLEDIELDGIARIGSLEVGNFKARNLKLEIKAAHGKLNIGAPGGKQ